MPTPAQEKAIRKLAYYAQEKLQHDPLLSPSAEYAFEPGFEAPDCVGDLDTLHQCHAPPQPFQWYRHVYGTWWEKNQTYRVPEMGAVVQLINLRGEVELHGNLKREDTVEVRSRVDGILSSDTLGDRTWFTTMLVMDRWSVVRTQLEDLKELAHKRRIDIREDEAMAPADGGEVATEPAMDDDGADRVRVNEDHLPKIEYFCDSCHKKLFFTRLEYAQCDDCGCLAMQKPRTKKAQGSYDAR